MISRRGFLGGLLAAPAIIKVAGIMPVRSWIEPAAAQPLVAEFRAMLEAARGNRIRPILLGGKEFYIAYASPLVTLDG